MLVAYWIYGKNLFTILRFSAKVHPQKIALVDAYTSLNYLDLYQQSKQLAYQLDALIDVKEGASVALLCLNHSSLVKSLAALSGIGASAQLINLDLSATAMVELLQHNNYDLVIYDLAYWNVIRNASLNCPTVLSRHLTFESIERLSQKAIPVAKVALKGHGTVAFVSGKYPVLQKNYFSFLSAFKSLLQGPELARFPNTCIALPLYHHQGVFALINMLLLAKKVALSASFEPEFVKKILLKQKVQIIFLHPFLLRRLIQKGNLELIYLKRLIAMDIGINQQVLSDTFELVGDKLWSIYGSEEAPYALMATPQMLKQDVGVLGRVTANFALKIINYQGYTLEDGLAGQLCVLYRNTWYSTNDIAYKKPTGEVYRLGHLNQSYKSSEGTVYLDAIQRKLLDLPFIYQVHLTPTTKDSSTLELQVWLQKGAELDALLINKYLSEAGIQTDNYILRTMHPVPFNWKGICQASMELQQQWEL